MSREDHLIHNLNLQDLTKKPTGKPTGIERLKSQVAAGESRRERAIKASSSTETPETAPTIRHIPEEYTEEAIPGLPAQAKMIQDFDNNIKKQRIDTARKKISEQWQKEQAITLRNKLDELLQLRQKLGEIKVGGIFGMLKTKMETYFSDQPKINVNSGDKQLDDFINSSNPRQGLLPKADGTLEKLMLKIKNKEDQDIFSSYLVSLGQYTRLLDERPNENTAIETPSKDQKPLPKKSGRLEKLGLALGLAGTVSAVGGGLAHEGTVDQSTKPLAPHRAVLDKTQLGDLESRPSLLDELRVTDPRAHKKGPVSSFSLKSKVHTSQKDIVLQTNEVRQKQDLINQALLQQRDRADVIAEKYTRSYGGKVSILPERTDRDGNTIFQVRVDDGKKIKIGTIDLKTSEIKF